jgi:beta-glucosidase-like glycosyl hydrolase
MFTIYLLILALVNAAAMVPNPHTCAKNPSTTWCDHTKPIPTRVASLVNTLNSNEKAGLMTNQALAVPRLSLPAYNWWSEALHGVARDTGIATSFPQIIGVSSSYNQTLFKLLGTLTGTEARGKNNNLDGKQYHGLTMWAPNVNIFRDPRWGRGQETPGEDPTLNGVYAENFIQGMQGNESKNGYLRVSACLKHFAAYSEETGRESFAAQVVAQDMLDTYLPAFEQGVKSGKASGLMCSYNAETYGSGIFGKSNISDQYGAIPSCANRGLLNELIRDQWGFNGYVSSDCNAVNDVQNQHHYTNNSDDTIRAVLEAGMDTDCGNFMSSKTMEKFLSGGDSNMNLVNTALSRLFTIQMRLGFFDPLELNPFGKLGNEVVNTLEHQQLAKEASDQSLVLLKNNNNILPLSVTKIKHVAVLGEQANATTNMQGNYYGTPPFLISPLSGIGKYVNTTYDNGKNVNQAITMAENADAAVLVVGLNSEGAVNDHDEAEGHDRTSLILPRNQNAYIASIAQSVKRSNSEKPVILAVMSGGPVDIEQFRDSNYIDAIIWCGYPGQSGGESIADALFGRTNPSGKLTQTWYPEEFTKLVSLTDMGMRPNAKTGNPGRSYRFYTGPTVFKFGQGMSYSTFVHQHLKVKQVEIGDKSRAAVFATVEVINDSKVDGTEIVLLFGSPEGNGENGRPLKQLLGFKRVHLKAGGRVQVTLKIDRAVFSFSDNSGAIQSAGGKWKLWTGVDEDVKKVSLEL